MEIPSFQIEPPLHLLFSDGRYELGLVRRYRKKNNLASSDVVLDAGGEKVRNRALAAALLQSRSAQASLAESLNGNPARALSLLKQAYINLGGLMQLDEQQGEIISSVEEALLMQKPLLKDLGIQIKIPTRSINIAEPDRFAIFLGSFAELGKFKLSKEDKKFLENFFGEITQTIYASFARFAAGDAEEQKRAGIFLDQKYSKLIPALEKIGVNVDDLKMSVSLAKKGYLREYVLATNMLYEATDLIPPYAKSLSVPKYKELSSQILGTLDDLLENKVPEVGHMLGEIIPKLIESASNVNVVLSSKHADVARITETFLDGLNLRLGQVGIIT